MRKHQMPVYSDLWNAINDRSCLKYCLNIARRFGKSHTLCLVATEYAQRYPGSQIRFAAPTAKSLKKTIHPIFKIILADCPEEFLPSYHSVEDVYTFPNGSQIHFAGTDNGHAENLRGTFSHLNLVDEAGSMDDLQYIVKSILTPQTLTVHGTTIIASTPSVTPDHDYRMLYQECLEDGNVSQFTIHDNKSIDAETLEIYKKEAGGEDSTTWKREYLAMFVTDSDISVVPEWDPSYARTVEPDEYYKFYHKYISMDTGVRDFTVALFAYYDFKQATLYVEDEIVMNGPEMTTDALADAIRAKEEERWPGLQVNRRIADNNNLQIIQDLTRLHNLPFVPTSKVTLEAMTNNLRIMVKEGRIVVHPRCTFLLGCLEFGIWKSGNGKLEYARSRRYGHYDALAAITYLVRNLDTTTNPIPPMYKLSRDTHYIPDSILKNQSSNARELGKLLGRPVRR